MDNFCCNFSCYDENVAYWVYFSWTLDELWDRQLLSSPVLKDFSYHISVIEWVIFTKSCKFIVVTYVWQRKYFFTSMFDMEHLNTYRLIFSLWDFKMSIDRVLCDTIIYLCEIGIWLLWCGSFSSLMQYRFVLEYISFWGDGIFPSRHVRVTFCILISLFLYIFWRLFCISVLPSVTTVKICGHQNFCIPDTVILHSYSILFFQHLMPFIPKLHAWIM